MIKRINILLKRAWRGRQFGVAFRGTTSFVLPQRVKFKTSYLQIEKPHEDEELKYDFINIWLDDEYQLEGLERPKVLVDVGGNIGLFSLFAAQTFGPFVCHVYEPNISLHDHLERNLQVIEDLFLYGEGVASKTGWMNLMSLGSSRLSRPSLNVDETEGAIPVASISEVVDRAGGRVDLLKMDCEGGEWSILADVDALSNVKYIVMEYHLFEGKSFADFQSLVENSGFSIVLHNIDGNIVHLRNINWN